MQDRLKIRYFNKNSNKMVEPINYQNINSIYECIKQQVRFDEYLPILPYNHTGNGLIFTQCTGLKDKNGELVYFDDFIKLDDGIVCIVKQIEDINDIEYGKVVAIPVFCLNQKYQTRYIPTVITEGKKIGNLYENPELLEQTKADPFEHC